jgi:hypothetical protein
MGKITITGDFTLEGDLGLLKEIKLCQRFNWAVLDITPTSHIVLTQFKGKRK